MATLYRNGYAIHTGEVINASPSVIVFADKTIVLDFERYKLVWH